MNEKRWDDLISRTATCDRVRAEGFVQKERDTGKTIYPAQEDVFRAIELVPPQKVKVVILGQDPYINPGEANGLAFSVSPAQGKLPPSLRNIFKELEADLGQGRPAIGDLTGWAEQGVLLLNTCLTVEAGKSDSHRGIGWEGYTSGIIQACSRWELPPVLFILWGRHAIQMGKDLGLRHTITSSHPSPFSANKKCGEAPAFLGSRPFSKANKWLIKHGQTPINWVRTGPNTDKEIK